MSDWNKFILGVNLSSELMLTVADGPDQTQPDLVAVGRTASTQYKSYDQAKREWAITLAAGDYVLTLTLEQKDWFEGALACTADATVNFVYYGPVGGVDQLVAWSGTVAATGGDPKDPWPPPATPTVSLSGASTTWFTSVLSTARANQNTPRGAALGFE